MKELFHQRQGKITVAIGFDDRLERLVSAAELLCRRTGATLRLVHVCDPWARSKLTMAAEAGPEGMSETLSSEAARVAERRLTALQRTIGPGINVETEVLRGDVVQNLAADAEANEADLLVVGAHKGSIAGTSAGFSTAVSLIMEASTPIMVMNEDAMLDAAKPRLGMVIADDFSDVSKAALDTGMALALAMPGTEVVHVHVESYDDLHISRQLQKARAASANEKEDLTPERFEFIMRQAEEEMLARAGDRPGRIEVAGGRYQMEIVTGPVPDEICRTAASCRADIAVFGQHRLFHRQKPHVGHPGQVPFKSMLSQNRPVIVVPRHA